MPIPSLPFNDLPPNQITQADKRLRQELEGAISKRLYEGCDGVTQALLMTCEWSITTSAPALTLVINCSNMATYWRGLNYILPIGNQLGRFSSNAIIRVCPPVGMGNPYEIQVKEITAFRDSL